MKYYHNPKCSKSRQTLELLKENNANPEIIEYLKETPSTEELKDICGKLNIKPIELIRTGEDQYKNLKEEYGTPNDAKAIEWMNKYPILMQRPILVTDSKAAIGRPPESVLDII